MATISFGSYFPEALAFKMACCTFSHHISGLCSAQPFSREVIPVSVSGYCAVVIHCCVCASTIATLMEDVPISIPSSSIWRVLFYLLQSFLLSPQIYRLHINFAAIYDK